jgi:hypothetical protein
VVDGVPAHSLTTRTVERCGVFVIVHVRVVSATDGAVTGNGPPLYGCGVAGPQAMEARYPAGTEVSPTVAGADSGYAKDAPSPLAAATVEAS